MAQKDLIIVNDIQQLDYLHEQIELLSGEWELSPKLGMQLNLVLEEVITNIIFYGFPGKGRHDIEIHIDSSGGLISIVIQDDGILFNPLTVESPNLDVPVEERKIGGLGLHFVQTIMDEMIYERKNGKNILTLRKSYK